MSIASHTNQYYWSGSIRSFASSRQHKPSPTDISLFVIRHRNAERTPSVSLVRQFSANVQIGTRSTWSCAWFQRPASLAALGREFRGDSSDLDARIPVL